MPADASPVMPRARSIHIGAGLLDEVAWQEKTAPVPGAARGAQAMRDLALAAGFDALPALIDREANLTNVRQALVDARELEAGDRLLVTFVGHGGTERIRQGHWDEAWCLHDGPLVDNEINNALCWLDRGVRVTVVSDSCFSGSILETPAWRAIAESPVDPASRTPRCSALLLAACADNTVTYLAQHTGQFTEALLAVWNGGAFQGSHRAFLDEIEKRTGDRKPILWPRGADDPAFLAARPFSPVGDASEAPAAAGTTVRVKIPIEVTITVGTPIVERG